MTWLGMGQASGRTALLDGWAGRSGALRGVAQWREPPQRSRCGRCRFDSGRLVCSTVTGNGEAWTLFCVSGSHPFGE